MHFTAVPVVINRKADGFGNLCKVGPLLAAIKAVVRWIKIWWVLHSWYKLWAPWNVEIVPIKHCDCADHGDENMLISKGRHQ